MQTAEQQAVIHNTFVLERTYSASPERVFRALSDPAQKRRWYIDNSGNEILNYDLDFRVGGLEQAKFIFKHASPVQGLTCVNDGSFLEIVQDHRIVMASTMNIGGRTISASLITFEMLRKGEGTDLILTHQGAFFEHADGPKMREGGWQKLLDRLGADLQS